MIFTYQHTRLPVTLKWLFLAILVNALILSRTVFADIQQTKPYDDHTDFDEYSVYYSVFNSTFVPASVAANYGIKRSEYENLINVSISPVGEYGALPAFLSGSVRNLMQQQKTLKFIEIKEQNATYYIAPIRITNEEILHFELQVKPEGSDKVLDVKFSKKLYSEP